MEKDKSKIGDEFEVKGMRFEIKLQKHYGSCRGCAFYNRQCISKQADKVIPLCRPQDREDGHDVFFKKTPSIKNQIKTRLSEAKNKHPEFPTTTPEAMPLLIEEVGELAKAINDSEGKKREESELLDIVAVAIRMLENYKESEK